MGPKSPEGHKPAEVLTSDSRGLNLGLQEDSAQNVRGSTSNRELPTSFEKNPEKWTFKVPGFPAALKIPVKIGDSSRRIRKGWVVSGGVPFPEGALKDISDIRVLDSEFKDIAFQAKALARYQSDKSIKWARIDIKDTLDSSLHDGLFLICDVPQEQTSVNPITPMADPAKGGKSQIPNPKNGLTPDSQSQITDTVNVRGSTSNRENPKSETPAKQTAGKGAFGGQMSNVKLETNSRTRERANLSLKETSDAVVVDTGTMRFSVSRKSFTLFDGVWVDADGDNIYSEDEKIASSGDMIVGHKGELFKSSLDSSTYSLTVEEQGPLKICLKAQGWFRNQDGKGFCKFIVRIQAFAGEQFVRLYHTFVYTGYPENKYYDRYEDLKLPGNETVEKISLIQPFIIMDTGHPIPEQVRYGAGKTQDTRHRTQDTVHKPPALRADRPGGTQENGNRENRKTGEPDKYRPAEVLTSESRGFNLGLQEDSAHTGLPTGSLEGERANAQSVRGSTSNRKAGLQDNTAVMCNIGAEVGSYEGHFTQSISALQLSADKFLVRELNGKVIGAEKRCGGWVDISSGLYGMSAAVKDAWQQYPKGFYISKEAQQVEIELWPDEAGDLDLKTTADAFGPEAIARGNAFGLGKTHELLFYFHSGDIVESGAETLVKQFNKQPLLIADAQWICDTEALGKIMPVDTAFFHNEELMLINLFDWEARQPVDFKWYGMLNWGDVLSWYRKDGYDKSYPDWGWHPEGRWGWYSCESVGPAYGALIQFARSGDMKYMDFAQKSVKHIMDIDTCHYNTVANDARLKDEMSDEVSRVGSMHRHNADHWGGRNEEASHTNLTAILYYYYLTGYERAFEVAQETGEFFLTDPVTYTRHPDIAPSRAIANVLWGDALMYEATGDARFKKAADRLARLFVQAQSVFGLWPENYDPVSKVWNGKPHQLYITQYILPSLIAYYDLTGSREVADAITEAVDSLISMKAGYPFFDALAYSYDFTGEEKYLEYGKARLSDIMRHQQRSKDPLHDGMVYDKLIYHRPTQIIGNVPFILKVMRESGK